MAMLREQVSKRTDFLKNMIKGSKFLLAMKKYKEQATSEEIKQNMNIEFDFNVGLNKGVTKYNCLKLWNIDVLNTNEEQLDRAAEKANKHSTEIFNQRQMARNRNDGGSLLAKNTGVKNFLDFRKSNIQQSRSNTSKRYVLGFDGF